MLSSYYIFFVNHSGYSIDIALILYYKRLKTDELHLNIGKIQAVAMEISMSSFQ